MNPASKPNYSFVPAEDTEGLTLQADHLIDAGTTFAAGMAAALGNEALRHFTELRAQGWAACCEVWVNPLGVAGIRLTAVAADGRRKVFAELAQEPAITDPH